MSTKKLQILDYNIKQAENADTVDGKHANEFYPAQKRFVFGGDYNSLMTNGIYELLGTSERPTQNAPNGNNSNNDYYVQVFAHSTNYITQIATSGRRDKTQYIRSLSNGVWDSWEQIKSGDADTVDGKHASDFAAASDVSALQVKVGDTSVSEQISTAISEIDYPVDSVNGKTGAVMLTANDVGALPVDTEIPSISGLATETYVDSKVAGIVDSAPETLNTLNELSAALGDDPNFATTIATQIGGKVDKVNGKGLSTNDYTTGEKNKLAGIAAGANKTIIDSALSSTSTNPVQNKVVTTQINNLNTLVGDTIVSDQISTAIADKVDKVPGKGLSTNDYTTAEKNKLSGIASGAEVNQNAFSNVIVGSTTVAADTATDTLTLVAGNNVTLTPDATNDKITIAAKDTTYSAATTSAPGLMSASDKTKLNGIATGATKITVDSALSSTSTNPVQNKVVNTAISNLNTLVGDTAVSEQISAATDECITGMSVSGKVITYIKGDGTTGTITTQDTNTDTKVTNTLNTTTKAYVTGTTSSTTNTGTQIFDTGVYLDTTAGHLTATQFNGKLNGNATSASKVNNTLNINGVSYDGSAAKDIDLLPFIVGTQTAATGSWTGTASTISSLFDGLTIRYWLPYAGSGNATLNLTLANGTSSGAIPCYYSGTSRLSTHYGAGNIITLTYRKNITIAGSKDTYTGWWSDANYNVSNTAGSTDTTSKIFLIGATSQATATTTYSHKNVYANSDHCLYIHNTSAVNSYFTSKQTYTDSNNKNVNHQIQFGISSTGNRGIYDSDMSKWLIYANTSNKVTVNGDIVTGAISEERSSWTGITGHTFNFVTGRNRALILAWMQYAGSTYTGFNFITVSSSTTSSSTTLIEPSSTVGLYYSIANGNIDIVGGAEGASYRCSVIWFTV